MIKIETDKELTSLVHQRSIEILEEVGVCVPDPSTLARLEAASFLVNGETQMVRIPREMIEPALQSLPKNSRLYSRERETFVDLDERSHFMGAGTPVNVTDLDSGERREATRQDVISLVRLQDALPNVDIARPTVTATDMGPASDLVEIAELLRNTSKPIVHRTLAPERVDDAFEMLAAVAGGEDEFRTKPNFATLYCPISPAYFTKENIHCMLRWAEHGVPITILSMAMGGASAPATLLGALVVINLEILAWIVFLQHLYPGTPLLYGSVSSVLDMRTGILPLGAPERGMLNGAAAAMAAFYGVPSMCGGLSTDAKQLDAQAGFEKAVTAVPLMQNRTSIIYGVGAVDAGAAISYSQMVIDNELIGGLKRWYQGIAAHDLDEEVELIKSNIPRGNFMKEKHTLRHYKENWQPGVFNRDAYETWVIEQASIATKCNQIARETLAATQPQSLSNKAETTIDKVLSQFSIRSRD